MKLKYSMCRSSKVRDKFTVVKGQQLIEIITVAQIECVIHSSQGWSKNVNKSHCTIRPFCLRVASTERHILNL